MCIYAMVPSTVAETYLVFLLYVYSAVNERFRAPYLLKATMGTVQWDNVADFGCYLIIEFTSCDFDFLLRFMSHCT